MCHKLTSFGLTISSLIQCSNSKAKSKTYTLKEKLQTKKLTILVGVKLFPVGAKRKDTFFSREESFSKHLPWTSVEKD